MQCADTTKKSPTLPTRSKCATFPAQSSASPKPSPSHSLDRAWSTYHLAAQSEAKIAGKCRWSSSCSMVGFTSKWARLRQDLGLGRGVCGKFLEVSHFVFPRLPSPPGPISESVPKEVTVFYHSLTSGFCMCAKKASGGRHLWRFPSNVASEALGSIDENVANGFFPSASMFSGAIFA